jgi:flagellar basal body-associated protein FliL
MNHSIYSADRSTHLKIVVVALIAGIAVAGFGISARMTSNDSYAQNSRIIKAGQPVAITSSSTSMVR